MNWTEFFAIGSVGFWALLILETGLLIFLIEWGKGTFATLSLVGTLALFYFLGDINVFGFMVHHPITIGLGLIVYFAAGSAWAVAKWWLFVRHMRGRYDDLRADFCQEHGVDGPLPAELHTLWLERLESTSRRGRRIEVRPRARQHRGNIVTWMAYWPWSMAWTLLNDPVRQGFTIIYRHMHDYLQEISNNAFKGTEEDFPGGRAPEPPRPRLAELARVPAAPPEAERSVG